MEGLDEILQESIKILQEEFYKKKFNFSYSSLNKLLWNPQAFYQLYVLGNKEEKIESYLVNGKIIHALLLEPEKFDDQFVVSPDNLPTGNARIVVDRVFAHHQELAANGDTREMFEDFEDAILDVMKDMNYHQSLKTDHQRLDKVVTLETRNYWAFLKTKGNKTLIDQESLTFCKTAVDIIKLNPEICNLIGCNVSEFENKEVFNELPLECGITGKNFGLKGIIDNIVVNHDEQIIYINDIKTTSKDLKDFPESVEYYNYWLQAAIYCTIITIKFINLIDRGYQIKFHFVVIDKNYQAYAFPVLQSTLDDWFVKLQDVLQKASWHYDNARFDLPYEFALGKITL